MKKHIFTFISFFLIISSGISQEYGAGLNFDNAKYALVPQKALLTRSLYTEIPKSFSLKKYAPDVKSQGQFGTCVGWSTAYAGMTILESIHENRTDKTKTTENTFSPGFIYKQIKPSSDIYCKLGSSLNDALEILKSKGVCKYNEMEEVNCPTYISPTIFSSALKYKIKDYAKIFGMFDSKEYKILAVKKSISQKNPVIIGMNVPKSFYGAKDVWVPTESSSLAYGGHAMCVIGYDDSKYDGAFEIMNSWGTLWGNDGFIWVKYDDFHDFVKYAYEMIEFQSSSTIVTKNNFKASVQFIKFDGTESKVTLSNGFYKLTEPYKSGTKFRLYLSNSKPTYVYAIGSDATSKVFTIFPHNENTSAALNYSENRVAIPDEDHFIQTDNTLGKDYLCVIYSKNALDIEFIKETIENTIGSFSSKVKIALGDKLVENSEIFFEKDKISFSVTDTNKSIVVIIVETEHIE